MTLHKDGKKGFGFSIERGEKVGGSAAALVTNIIRGGPADLDGQLQVGDQILSVDGQKTVGYAYEKVRIYVGVVWCATDWGGGVLNIMGYRFLMVIVK